MWWQYLQILCILCSEQSWLLLHLLYCIHPMSSLSYPAVFHHSFSSYSRHIGGIKGSLSLGYHLAHVLLSCISLSLFHARFCSQVHLIGTGWMLFMSHLYCLHVWWEVVSFWPFQPKAMLTRTTEVWDRVTGEDPEFCFLLPKLSKFKLSWIHLNADFAPVFSSFCMLLKTVITY